MAGGDVETLIAHADDRRVPLDRALAIADQVCQALAYAHSRGIVHRDLKPGNVWLTQGAGADERGLDLEPQSLTPSPQHPTPNTQSATPSPQPPPVAKLGDFGLAVALDRSRLTQPGMMVGTVHYMPPEQAIGGEVTPRSDLYALGAMLYEMVCGRPPFVGDEAVAIITQHLNTPPVAPSWHVPDLSPGLEALILRLLEKDPAKRPASASEVRQALANLSPSPSPARGGEPSTLATAAPARGGEPSTLAGAAPPSLVGKGDGGLGSPLYRRTFVGRETELRQLEGAFDAAVSGQGSLAMVVGEPGIGKTSVCEQLATFVAVRGGRALVGHCYEEGSLSLPYLPFVEGMRSYVLGREAAELERELGSGAAEVARLETRRRAHNPKLETRNSKPSAKRWRTSTSPSPSSGR